MANTAPRIGLTFTQDSPAASVCRRVLQDAGARVTTLLYGAGSLGNPRLATLDGLVLSGGGDVHPWYFGEPLLPLSNGIDEDRDALEIALVREAAATGVPVLGVCRGMQVLNIALGGSIYQDTTAQNPPESQRHKFARDDPERFHTVRLAEGSWLHRACGRDELVVNSHHHQAIKDVAPGLRVVGRAPDGVLEAVEASDSLPTMVGVQWHPERLGADGLWTYAAFVQECRRRTGS